MGICSTRLREDLTEMRIVVPATVRKRLLLGAGVAAVAVLAATPAGAALPRAATDRPDDRSSVQVHFLYVVPRDGVDRALDTGSVISASVNSWQAWLRRQTGGRELYVDTSQGELDVSFFRLATDDAVVAGRGPFVREQIEEEIFAAGFNSPTKTYAVYYDGTSTWSCGGADPQPTFRGSVAAMYLRGAPTGAPPCASNPLGVTPPGYFEFGMLHELMHNLGFVPSCAPHVTQVDHVSDSPFDLMWGGDAPWGVGAPEAMRLDVGHDDYYGHGRADCPDFAHNPYLAPPALFELAVAASGRGAGRVEIEQQGVPGVTTCPPDCVGTFRYGSEVKLTAAADDGSLFTGWEGACSGTDDICMLSLDATTSVKARFAKKQYKVGVSVQGPGRIRFQSTSCLRRCSRLVEYAEALVLRAIPQRGARFIGWSGACRGTRPCRLVVKGPISVIARFRPPRTRAG